MPNSILPPLYAKNDSTEEKNWAAFAHLGGILWFIPSLFVYFAFRKSNPFIRKEAAAAINFSFPLFIFSLIIIIIDFIFGFILFLIVPAYLILVFFSIRATLHINKNKKTKYPINLKFIY